MIIIVYFCYQSIREQYRNYWEDQQYQELVFDSDEKMLILDLPAEPKVVDGWKILPMIRPKVQIKIHYSQTEIHLISFDNYRSLK